jgi:uncharacterized protein YdhG (YjbR/CyaY superfamily)
MPTFRLDGKNLVYFSAFKTYIGFYPTPSGITRFKKELTGYHGKGSVQFPLTRPLPYDLVSRIVSFRVKEIKKKKITLHDVHVLSIVWWITKKTLLIRCPLL